MFTWPIRHVNIRIAYLHDEPTTTSKGGASNIRGYLTAISGRGLAALDRLRSPHSASQVASIW